MTQSYEDDQTPAGGHSNLLLTEVRSLSKEIGQLRRETTYLAEVTVPREEMARKRKIMIALVLLGFLALALPLGLFYVTERNDEREDRAFAERVLEFERETVKACQTRNRALENDAKFAADLIRVFEEISNDNPRASEYLSVLRQYQAGLGEKANCSRREALIQG